MRVRSLAASLLLVAAAFCTVQAGWDQAAFHLAARQQWRASAHHQGAVRHPQRQTTGVAGLSFTPAVLGAIGRASTAEHLHASSSFVAAVFVPPRVESGSDPVPVSGPV